MVVAHRVDSRGWESLFPVVMSSRARPCHSQGYKVHHSRIPGSDICIISSKASI
jgi:hypothetical protein